MKKSRNRDKIAVGGMFLAVFLFFSIANRDTEKLIQRNSKQASSEKILQPTKDLKLASARKWNTY